MLEVAQGAGVDRGLLAQLAGQGVEVDVVHPRPGVLLGQLLAEVVELGEVLQHARAVAEAQALVAAERLGAVPVLARAHAPAGLPSSRASPCWSAGDPNACC